jgi:hypothetical protein
LNKKLVCAKPKGNKLITCPHCHKDFRILKDNVTPIPVPNCSGGCSFVVTCTVCKVDSCFQPNGKSYEYDEFSI